MDAFNGALYGAGEMAAGMLYAGSVPGVINNFKNGVAFWSCAYRCGLPKALSPVINGFYNQFAWWDAEDDFEGGRRMMNFGLAALSAGEGAAAGGKTLAARASVAEAAEPGVAMVYRWPATKDSTHGHYAVEISSNGKTLASHHDRSGMIKPLTEEEILEFMKLDGAKSGLVDLPNANAAFNYSLNSLGKTRDFTLTTNCGSYVGDVLEVGGAKVPKDPIGGLRFLLSIVNQK